MEWKKNRDRNNRIKQLLERLKHRIKEIRSIEVGINTNDSPDAFDIVLYSEFDNINDLNAYQNHPEHLKVGEFVSKVRLERKVVDYEV